jgi:hypothetical protein
MQITWKGLAFLTMQNNPKRNLDYQHAIALEKWFSMGSFCLPKALLMLKYAIARVRVRGRVKFNRAGIGRVVERIGFFRLQKET